MAVVGTRMNRFLYKLIPPRPTFAMDLSDEEAAVMGDHAGYWGGLVDEDVAVVFGPVADPSGSWGLAVVEADSEDEVRRLGEQDPAVTSGVATFEIYAMPDAVARPRA
jgi:uncharacterized protein YciI